MEDAVIIGTVLILFANYLQIAEEWTAHGLTDTSYSALCCIGVGAGLLANKMFAPDWALWIFALGSGLAAIAIGVKISNYITSRFGLLR